MSVQQSVVLGLSRNLEQRLARLGAKGQGLHQATTSIETRLPAELVKKLRFVASVRNTVVHKNDVSSKQFEDVQTAATYVAADLDAMITRNASVAGNTFGKIVGMTVLLAAFVSAVTVALK